MDRDCHNFFGKKVIFLSWKEELRIRNDDDEVDDEMNDSVPEGQGTHGPQVLEQGAAQQQDTAQHHVGPTIKYSRRSKFWETVEY